MLKLRPKTMREPYGGHHYSDHGVTFRGETKDEVVKKLTDFRVANHLKVGNPDQDVLRFYATHWPWLVQSDGLEDSGSDESDYEKWREWVQRLWVSPPGKFITIKEARSRWDICLKCPFNTEMSWSETNESLNVSQQAFLLRRGIDIPKDLGYCSLHSADISILSFLDNTIEYSQLKKDQCKPRYCWVGSLSGP